MSEVARLSDDPGYRAGIIASFLEKLLPDWAPRAACAGQPTKLWFKDHVADRGEATVFPETVYDALRVCATCPVQRECLEWAYEQESDPPDPWRETTDADKDRYGCFAVPGPIRERYADSPTRVDDCLAWLSRLASSPERRWVAPPKTDREETA